MKELVLKQNGMNADDVIALSNAATAGFSNAATVQRRDSYQELKIDLSQNAIFGIPGSLTEVQARLWTLSPSLALGVTAEMIGIDHSVESELKPNEPIADGNCDTHNIISTSDTDGSIACTIKFEDGGDDDQFMGLLAQVQKSTGLNTGALVLSLIYHFCMPFVSPVPAARTSWCELLVHSQREQLLRS